MKIALLEPSQSLRSFFRSAIEAGELIEWCEFEDFTELAQTTLINEAFDVIVTAKELRSCSYDAVLKLVHNSNLNKETPVFLLSSDQSDSFMNIAFQLGVTDVLSKQEIASLKEVLHRILHFSELGKGARILMIEDDKSIAEFYSTVLSHFGFEVAHSTSATDAIEMLGFYEFELVITDLNLKSGGLGQHVIRELRRQAKVGKANIPIMVLSSSAMSRHQTGLFYLGIDEYLVKPVPPRQLCLRSAQLVQKYRAEKTALANNFNGSRAEQLGD